MPRFFMGKPLESVEHVAFFMENVWFAMGFIVWPEWENEGTSPFCKTRYAAYEYFYLGSVWM